LREVRDPFFFVAVGVVSFQSYALQDDGGVGKAEEVGTIYWDDLETTKSVCVALKDEEEEKVEYRGCSLRP
jgi:hypothetical protein